MNWSTIVHNVLAMITPQMEAGLIGIAMTAALVWGMIHHQYGWFWGVTFGGAGLVSIVWMLQTAYGVAA